MKTLKYISVVLVLLAASSCRTLEEFNENPNQIEVNAIHPSGMMDELIVSGALNCQQRFYDTYAELMQYTCVTSSSNEVVSRYYIAPSYLENCWNNFARWAANADHMISLAEKNEDDNYKAVALTLRAMYMDMLVSTFGPVPFSEAFRIRTDDINKPKFDNEQEIYTQLILDLEEANKLYKIGTTLYNAGKDKLYGGDVKKWQKFTNSLKLRLLMRVSLRSNDFQRDWGATVIEKIKEMLDNPADFPVMVDNEDNAAVYFTGESPFQNSWGGYTQSTLAGHRMTEHMYNLMHPVLGGGLGCDPRLCIWFMPYSASYGWIGIQSGIPGDDMQSSGYSVMNFRTMNDYKLPYSFMNCDEVYFLKAEAYARTGDDWVNINCAEYQLRDLYNTGIRKSCEFWRQIYVEILGYNGNIVKSAGQAYRSFFAVNEDYNDETPYVYKDDGDTEHTLYPVICNPAIEYYYTYTEPLNIGNALECILKQKYLAMFRVGLEGWCDYRRTGIPTMTILDGTYNNHILPHRLVYPSKTKTTNDANYQANIKYLANKYYDGADNMLCPIWWSEEGLVREIR